jgi:hypothetical protein
MKTMVFPEPNRKDNNFTMKVCKQRCTPTHIRNLILMVRAATSPWKHASKDGLLHIRILILMVHAALTACLEPIIC